ncbi:MAG TPA: hypothetical protein DHU89_06555 [Flavobacteriales bacterium]|nr:hypothetical protein [Flavobacteriales bacterium]|tara:strand:+ start:32749 stop:37110 length:4362 start_codon:yes stop_codon:yes gene_type:complete
MKQLYSLLLMLIICVSAWSHDKRQALEFVENQNQWNENVLFRAGLPNGGSVYLEENGFTFSFLDAEEFSKLHDLQFATVEEQMAFSVPGHAWKLNLINALETSAEGDKKKSYHHNYFLGQNENRWSSDVGVFEMVDYTEIYTGIDLKVYSKKDNFKYDFIVYPGSNPDQIAFDYDGLQSYFIKDGNLILVTSLGEFTESKPFAYQLVNGQLREVACDYVKTGNTISYAFPDGYDERLKLVIDPELIASTLSGTTGFSSNYGHSAAFDLEGNIFTGCVASGSEYPVTTGAFDQSYGGGTWDIGISKLNPEGTDLLWATFLGGSSADYPHSLVTNNEGELYVYGSSASADFPVTGGAVQTAHADGGGGFTYDIVVSHLEQDGSALIGSTYLGGTGTDGQNANAANYGDNYRGEIIVDYDNNPIIVSGSQSPDFPVTAIAYQTTNAGGQDAVIVKLNPTLSTLLISTYFGGTDNDMGYGIRTSIDGSIFIAGSASDDMPTTPGAYQTNFIGEAAGFGTELDGFIAKFNGAGTALINSTYHGTDSKDQVFFMDLDFEESVFVFGQGGGDMPVTDDVYENPNSGQFITKFSNDLSEVLVGTVVGSGSGNTDFVPDAFLVDNCDNIYISAYSAFGALETTDDALFTTGGFYLAVYEEDLTDIIFGTFYTENHVDGGTSRFDKNGIVYQGVCSGGGFSTTADAWATNQEPGWDIGVFKINFDASGVNAALASNDISGCAPFEITFENFSVGDQFDWDFGNGTTSDEYEPSLTYDEPGVYDLTMIASDSLSCNLADTVAFQIVISTPQDFNPTFNYDFNCIDQIIETTNTTGLDFLEYIWDMGDGTIIESIDAIHQYDAPGDYTVSLQAIDNGCEDDEEVTVDITLLPFVEATISSDGLEGCESAEIVFENQSENADNISWDFGDGSSSAEETPTHTFNGPAEFEVILTALNPNTCNGSDSDTVLVTISANDVVESIFDLLQTDCENYTVEGVNNSLGNFLEFQWDMGDGTVLEEENITYDYDDIGMYTVSLSIEDVICNVSDESSVQITITDEVAAFITNGDEVGCAPLSIDFNNNSVGASSYSWDFGDGTPSNIGENTSHIYATPGIYIVTLSVEGDGGCTGIDEATSLVEVLPPPVLEPSFDNIQLGACNELTVDLTNTSIGDIDNYSWDLGDGNASVAENLIHVYNGEGTYTITLTVSENFCGVEESISQTVAIEDYEEFELGENIPLCYYSPAVAINAGLGGQNASYFWSTNEDTQSISVTEAGIYSVQVELNGCTFQDAVQVSIAPEISIEKTEVLCKGAAHSIEIPYLGGSNHFWITTDESDIYTNIIGDGLYEFTFTDAYGCEQAGSIDVILQDNEPTIFIPNAFTPNGDGLNDVFKPVNANLDEYSFKVYNRWGNVVFETEDTDDYWQGEQLEGNGNEGYYVPVGVYTYEIRYSSNCNTEAKDFIGQISVVR